MNSNKKNRNTSSLYKSASSSTRRSHSRKRRRPSPLPYIIIAGIIVLVILVLIIKSLFGGGKDEDESEAESIADEISTDAIFHYAAIDLSDVLPESTAEEDKLLYIQGMTPAEISRAISALYEWDFNILNDDAEVGEIVIQTVDADATTEAATMGDEDNPDGAGTMEEAEEEDLTVAASIAVPDYIAAAIPALLEEIVAADESLKAAAARTSAEETTEETKKGLFSGKDDEEDNEEESTGEEEEAVVYKLSLTGLDEKISGIASLAATMWYVEPQGGSIGSYDSANDKFIMESSKAGYRVDQEELAALLTEALSAREYVKDIDVPGTVLSAESFITVGEYQTLATYVTHTTNNEVRNKNVRLACETLNGTIVRPGEVFSFNDTIGQRTTERGYGEAAAYSNGEVVQEVGGGVCQVSTTLYNAVVEAGLKTTMRQSHTFEPSYITPGQDATISWGGPDYRFANTPAISDYSNTSSYAIGIRARYSDRTVTVSIYGRPVLKSGYSYSLSSEKTKDLELVRVAIEEGSDREPETGTQGSVWETRLVIKKDGETISSSVDHMAYYTGHTEYYIETSEEESTEESVEEEIITDNPVISDDVEELDGPAGPGSAMGPGSSSVIMPFVSAADEEDEDEEDDEDDSDDDTGETTETITSYPVISSGSSGSSAVSIGPGSN